MRRPRLRFTLLGLMALVAMMALGLGMWVGATRSAQRARFFRARAEEMTRAEQDHRNRAAGFHDQVISKEVVVELHRERAQDENDQRSVRKSLEILEYMRKLVRDEDRLADYYHDLGLKYGRAASRPWETVGPDPPPPRPHRFVVGRR